MKDIFELIFKSDNWTYIKVTLWLLILLGWWKRLGLPTKVESKWVTFKTSFKNNWNKEKTK